MGFYRLLGTVDMIRVKGTNSFKGLRRTWEKFSIDLLEESEGGKAMKMTIRKIGIIFLFMGATLCLGVLTVTADPLSIEVVNGDYYVTGGGTGFIAFQTFGRLTVQPGVAWVTDSFSWEGYSLSTPMVPVQSR